MTRTTIVRAQPVRQPTMTIITTMTPMARVADLVINTARRLRAR